MRAPAVFSLLVVAFAGCASGGGLGVPRGGEALSDLSMATLGPGDIIEVRVYQDKDLSGIYQISSDGTIDFPLIGKIEASNKTASDVAKTIQERLRDGYFKDPFVSVVVREVVSKLIYVLGQVEKPGTFPYREGMTIVHAITLAGGLTKIARPNSVVVTRVVDGKENRILVPLKDISEGKAKNFSLMPGDIIFVPESIF
jgi:protein involved in polysaccharide export with SLBB domain